MSLLQHHYTSKKLFLFIISLLILLQGVTVVIAQTTDNLYTGNVEQPTDIDTTKVTTTDTVPDNTVTPPPSTDTSATPTSETPSTTTDTGIPDTTPSTPPETTTSTTQEIDKNVPYVSSFSATASSYSLPKLILEIPPQIIAGEYFTIRVLDNGIPVGGVIIDFIGMSVTDANGYASFTAPQVVELTRLLLTAEKAGYDSTAAYLSITVPLPTSEHIVHSEQSLPSPNYSSDISYDLPSILTRLFGITFTYK